MAIKMKKIGYSAPAKQILAIPDHYVALGQVHLQATADAPGLAVLVDGRYIVKAGTIWPANDATAQGVVLNEYDVTDGDKQLAIVYHGFIKEEALPVAPSAEAKTALPLIKFVEKVE